MLSLSLTTCSIYAGKPERQDPTHPDYVPSKFTYCKTNPSTEEHKLRRHKSLHKRHRTSKNQMEENYDNAADFQKDSLCSNYCIAVDTDASIPSGSYGDASFGTGMPVENPLQAPAVQPEFFRSRLEAENNSLRKERDEARKTIHKLKSKFLSYENIISTDGKFKRYTGISKEVYDAIFDAIINPSLPQYCHSKLSFKDQFLMTLIKLRLNIPFENLADQFNCARSSIAGIFKRWITLLHTKLSFLIKWPDHDACQRTLPHTFAQYFPRLTAIIDCTEIFIDRPRNLKARAQVYSNYKKHSTVKFLVACTPQGSISFLSKAWGGRVSDVELVKNSGFISYKYHHPGDQILADRGFTLVDDFAAGCGVELILPSFTKGKKQLSPKEVELSRQIASVRIHVERIIGLVKNRYKILDRSLPTTLIKSISDEANDCDITSVDKLVTVCCALVNLGGGIVYNEA